MSERLRITGGSHRGRKILSPPKNTIRPASDLVRQAVFNMLGDSVIDAIFYDVFAGTGIVGIEALSRGAARTIFIERDKRQLSLIRQNLKRVELDEFAAVRGSDALVWAKHFHPDPEPTIVFLGPPYPLFDTNKEAMWEMVRTLQSKLTEQDILVLQLPSSVPAEELPEAEEWYRVRHYGKTRVGIWTRYRPEDDDDEVEQDQESESESDEQS